MRNSFAPTALSIIVSHHITTAADSYGALAVVWIPPTANAVSLMLYFFSFKRSRISVRSTSSFVGSGSGAGAGASSSLRLS